MTWWKVFPRRLLNRIDLQTTVLCFFSKASHRNLTTITSSCLQNIINDFLIYLPSNHKRKRMSLYSEAEKDAQPWRRWGIPTGSPAISLVLDPRLCPYGCDTSPVLPSWRSREHKAHCICFSWEAVQLLHSPQEGGLKPGRGHRPGVKQSSRPSASIL